MNVLKAIDVAQGVRAGAARAGGRAGSPAAVRIPSAPAPIRILVAIFVVASVAITLQLPLETRPVVSVARWVALGGASLVCLVYVRLTHLTAQSVAWLFSAAYAGATGLYTIDLPSTILRSAAFAGLVLGSFIGGSILHRYSSEFALRLTRRASIVLLIVGIISITGWALGWDWCLQLGGYLRGPFTHCNTLGAMGAMWILIATGVADRRSDVRNIAILCVPTTLLILVGSHSRAGLGSALIGLGLYIWATRPLQRIMSAILVVVTLAILSVTVASGVGEATRLRTREFLYKGQSKDLLLSRRENMEVGWNNFLGSPWFGHGFGTSVGDTAGEWRLVGLGGREKGNAIIAVLEETGLVGTAVLSVPIVFCILQGLRYKRVNALLRKHQSPLAVEARLGASLWAGAIAGLANNMAEASLWSPGTAFGGLLLFLAGSADAVLTRVESECR